MELLAVLAIMAILTAALTPSIVGIISGDTLSNNVYELSALVQQAKTGAMAQHTYVWLGFYSYTQSGAPALLVATVSGKSGLSTDIQTSNTYQGLTKTALLKNAKLDSTNYQSLPGVDTTDNQDVSSSLATFTLNAAGVTNATFKDLIAFAPDGSVYLTQSGGTLSLAKCVGVGLDLGNGAAGRVAAVQIHGLSGQISVFQK